MGGKKRRRKKVNVSSARGKRRAENTETTGNVLRIVGFVLMIVFYIVMIYFALFYKGNIDQPLDQFTNSTQSSVFFNLLKIY